MLVNELVNSLIIKWEEEKHRDRRSHGGVRLECACSAAGSSSAVSATGRNMGENVVS